MHLPDFSLPITNPVLIFALVMVMMLVLPLLFRRIRVPGIVALIIAGVIIGPHSLGVLARDQTMELLGTVGILYIMFLAGLEVDLNEFHRQRNRSLIFGAATFLLPEILGTLVGRFVLDFDWPGSILLGAVFASHTLLAYPIVSRLGLSKSEAVTTAVGATILTDTAALLVLAIIVRSAGGALTTGFWLQMTVVLAAYVFGVLWGVPRLGTWFFRKVRSNGELEFVFVLSVVFVCAYLAAVAGVEPIIGAFLAGLALNRLVPEHSTLMSRTRFVGESLFIPFFLISVGMLVDLNVVAGDTGAWTVAGVMLGTVVAAKYLAAAFTRPMFGYSTDTTWMLFGLTIPQAAATLATVLIGYGAGIFGDSVLNGTILMILATCMVGPWFAERYGRRVALQADRSIFEPSRAPQRILVPLANPETAPLLMDMALLIRKQTSEQPIFPLAIVRNEDDVQVGVAAGEKLLAHAVVHAAAADIPVNPIVRIDRNVANGIMRAVRERMISTIIIGWNGRTSGRNFVFSSILDQLLEESHELVLVNKIEHPVNTAQRIVLAIPPFAHLEAGFPDVEQMVKVLASQLGTTVLIVAVADYIATIGDQFKKLKPDVPTAYAPLRDWAELVSVLNDRHQPEDLIALVAARKGTLSWRPALNRLPHHLARRFPNLSLVLCYPSVPVEEGTPTVNLPSGEFIFGGLIADDQVVLDLKGKSANDVLGHLMRDAFQDRPDLLRRTLASLPYMEADYVPELMPGVVLYHAHVPGLTASRLFIGISPSGFGVPGSPNLTYVVLALLSPEGGSAEDHLRNLALAARLVRSSSAIEELRSASSPAEVREILAENLLAPQFGWQHRTPDRHEKTAGTLTGGAFHDHVGVIVRSQSDLKPLFAEALQRTILLGKKMSLLHAGPSSSERATALRTALSEVGLSAETPIHWIEDGVEDHLHELTRNLRIDLLMTETIEDHRMLGMQLGAFAQALVQRPPTSVLLLNRPQLKPEPYRRIVFLVEYARNCVMALQKTLRLAERERAEHVFVVRVIPEYGDARILVGDAFQDEGNAPVLNQLTEEQALLDDLLNASGESTANIQSFYLSGRTGFAATQFARKYKADLLVVPLGDWDLDTLDRLDPSEMSWGLREASCDIWIVRDEPP